MEKQTITEAMTQSKETIAAYSNFVERFKKRSKFSRRVRLIFALLTLGVAVYAGISVGLDGEKWYFILLAAVLGGLAAYAVAGVILFVCKPIFFIQRNVLIRSISEVEEKDAQVLEEKCQVLAYYIENTPMADTRITNVHHIRIPSVSSAFDCWVDEQNAILELSCRIREEEFELDKYEEWSWILGALAISISAVLLYFFIMAFIVLVIMVGAYIMLTADRRTDTYRSSRYSNDREFDNNEGMLSGIWDAITGRMNRNVKMSTEFINDCNKQLVAHKDQSNVHLDLLIEMYYPDMDNALVEMLRYSDKKK